MTNTKLSAERARELFSYDPETGELRWRLTRGRAQAGGLAGRMQVEADGVAYLVHRVAWLITTGEWSTRFIDHINGIKSDNRLSNLREVTKQVNAENRRRARTGSKSGFLGVSPSNQKYQARISSQGVESYLGVFPTPEEAYEVYLTAKRSLHAGCTI